MCKIWISWISTTDFSRVIVGYLRLHNILAIFRREKPLGAAGGVAVRVVDPHLGEPEAARLTDGRQERLDHQAPRLRPQNARFGHSLTNTI